MSVQHNIDETLAKLERIFNNFEKSVPEMVNDTAEFIRDKAKENLVDKGNYQTGNLHRSIKDRSIPGGVEVYVDADMTKINKTSGGATSYAELIHFGYDPFKIFPKKKKALRWPNGGVFAFAKAVNHPGYKGNPFFNDAVDSGIRHLQTLANNFKLRD